MKTYLLAVLLAGLAFRSPISAQVEPRVLSLDGQLRSVDGTTLAGAQVMLARRVPGAVASTPVATGGVVARTRTDSNGRFLIPMAPAGDYHVCVIANDSVHLDPCEWGPAPALATLTSSKGTSLGSIQVPKGAQLKVVVDDRQGYVVNSGAIGSPSEFMVGVYTAANLFRPLHLESTVESGRGSISTYSLAIPFDTDLQIGVIAQKLILSDAGGKQFKQGGDSTPVRIPTTQPSRTVTFTVSGRSR